MISKSSSEWLLEERERGYFAYMLMKNTSLHMNQPKKKPFAQFQYTNLNQLFWQVTEIASDMAESLRERVKRDFGEDFFRERCNALGLDFD